MFKVLMISVLCTLQPVDKPSIEKVPSTPQASHLNGGGGGGGGGGGSKTGGGKIKPPVRVPGGGVAGLALILGELAINLVIDHLPEIMKQIQSWFAVGGVGRSNVLTGQLKANRTAVGHWEKFLVIVHSQDTKNAVISIAAHTGYLCAEEGGGGDARANRKEVKQWEKWTLVLNDDGTVSFRSHNGHYLSVQEDGESVLANRDSIGAWEKFRIERITGQDHEGNDVPANAIKTWRGTYLTAEKRQ